MKLEKLFCLLLVIGQNMATAQIKFDYNWVLGYPADINFPNPKYNGTLVDFNTEPTEYYYFDIGVKLNANAAISDSTGKLLFYTNGCEIINKNHKKMINGDDINAGGLSFQQECKSNIYPYGYSTHQGVLILPFPDMPNQYVLLHLRKSDTISREYILDLLYSIVDISGDDGFGAVLSKNNFVYHDTFCDMLTAVRHGNGRDWWILIPRYNTAEYYTFLLSPEGIGKPIIQKIGEPIKNFRWGVQAAFSPNGAKYVNHTPLGGLQIFNFDRCAGLLSNPVRITFPNDTIGGCGVAFSSTSRFLYASNTLKLYQFDLQSVNISKSRQVVGVYDGFEDALPTTFYQMQLAPDNKIYMTCTFGVKYWHIIHTPDNKGLDCNLEQHYPIPTYHGFSPPNFPHFRLFDAHDSPCDTLGINGPPPPEDTTPPPPQCAGNIRIYPNPAQRLAQIELPDCEGGSLRVFDAMGRWVEDLALAPESVGTELDVSRYVPGIYFLHIRTATGEAVVRGLVVAR